MITQDLFWAISLWVARMIIPAYDSGLALDAKDASENAINLRSQGAICCFFAVLASIRVVTVAY